MYFKGIGTIVNTLLVILGGFAGLLLKKSIRPSFRESIEKVLGLSVIFIGASGALAGLLEVSDTGSLSSKGSMLMILSLVSGMITGELLRLEYRMESLGEVLKAALHSKDSSFVEAFVSTTLIICIGAMAVVGSLQDGLIQDPSMLYAKAILDCIIALVTASTLGIGAVFSAIPLFLYQGGITLLSASLKPLLTDTVISNLSYIGSVMIFATGINLMFGKKIKVGNMLPALITVLILGKWF